MLTKEEILHKHLKAFCEEEEHSDKYMTVEEIKDDLMFKPMFDAMEEYYNQKDWQQHIMERAEWLDIEENRKSVLSYEFSPEVVSYIKQTHAFVPPCFYLLSSGEWAKIVAKKNKDFTEEFLLDLGFKEITKQTFHYGNTKAYELQGFRMTPNMSDFEEDDYIISSDSKDWNKKRIVIDKRIFGGFGGGEREEKIFYGSIDSASDFLTLSNCFNFKQYLKKSPNKL